MLKTVKSWDPEGCEKWLGMLALLSIVSGHSRARNLEDLMFSAELRNSIIFFARRYEAHLSRRYPWRVHTAWLEQRKS